MGVSLTDDEQAALLGTHGTAVVATVSPQGNPIPLPVWYVVVDGTLYIRTPRTAKRVSHIAHHPRVGLLVHAGEAWSELRGVLVNGRATIVESDDEIARAREAIQERFADLMPPPFPDAVRSHYDDTLMIRIDPVGTNRTWDNRKIRL